jgi:hypothetical protein
VTPPCRRVTPLECSERTSTQQAHELLRGLEPVKVITGLGNKPDSGQDVDPAEATPPADQVGVSPIGSDLLDRRLEPVDPAVDQIDREQVVIERLLLLRQVERLAAGHALRVGPQQLVGMSWSWRSKNFESR